MASSYKFHFTESGNTAQPPVVFLHGFIGCGSDWSGIATELSNSFHSLMPDLPGHGRTIVEGSDESYLMEYTARGLIDWLDSISIDKCYLVAYSMGGRLGLYLAINYPDRFDKIVLESSSPGLKTAEERTARRTHDNGIANKLQTAPMIQFLREWYDQPLFTSLRQQPQQLAALLENRSANDREGLAKSLQMMGTGRQPSMWPRLGEVKSDTLLIVGEKDAKFRAIAKEMAGLMPDATISVVADTGHNVHFEKPDEFAALVKRFLMR